MTLSKLGALVFTAATILFASPALAQNPNPDQVQHMLQTNPALLQQLRQKIMTSGLTPDQVRARLRAEGYPENLLDAYLPGGKFSPDSTSSTEDVFAAIGQLGIADTTELNLLRCGISPDSLAVPDTLSSGLVDTVVNKRRLDARRKELMARCLAQRDSLNKGINAPKVAADSGFAIFGLDFFRNPTTQFDPNLSGPVDASYKVGPGDRLVLVLTGDVEQS